MKEFGAGFLTSTAWDPSNDVYGAATFLFGTALTSFGALLLAAPISIAIALFLTELAPRLAPRPGRRARRDARRRSRASSSASGASS